MQKTELKAEPRTVVGRKVKSLRKAGFVPAVIYGHDFKPLNVQIPLNDFEKVYAEAGESTVVYLKVDNQDYPTIIHDVVKDAVNDRYVHADFYKVRLDEKIHADIELKFVGEAPAVKDFGGILVRNMSEIEVEGFPQDLPHEIVVDVSILKELNSHIMVKDLPIASNLEVKAEPEAIVALIQEPISEEELKAQMEAETAAPEDVEVIKKEKPEEEGEESAKPEPAPDKKEEKE